MKNIKLSLITIIGLGTVVYAGGDISPVTLYETNDEILASDFIETTPVEIEEVAVSPIVEPIIEEIVVPSVIDPIITPPVTEPIIQEVSVLPAVIEETTLAPQVEQVVKQAVVKPTLSTNLANGFYLGVGATLARYQANCDCIEGEDDTYGAVVKMGYHINEYIAIEGRGLSTPIQDDGGRIDHLGIYLKPSYPINNLSLYGLIGLGKSETTETLRKTDVNGLAWGAGVDYNLNEKFSLFADYGRLFQKTDSPDLDTINLGVNYNF